MKARYAFALIAISISSAAQAAMINPGNYTLHNHPDGGARPPLYGMRLDELINVTGGHDVFTFNFDHEKSEMKLTYTGSQIHIYGKAYGGLDTGSSYGNATYRGVWNIDFTYNVGVGAVPGDDDIHVVAPTGSNSGTISHNTLGSFGLVDMNMDYNFRFGDENNDLGHRGYNGISGWGWMNHGGRSHVESSDWLFTAVPCVPEPGTMLILSLGATLMRNARRRAAR